MLFKIHKTHNECTRTWNLAWCTPRIRGRWWASPPWSSWGEAWLC